MHHHISQFMLSSLLLYLNDFVMAFPHVNIFTRQKIRYWFFQWYVQCTLYTYTQYAPSARHFFSIFLLKNVQVATASLDETKKCAIANNGLHSNEQINIHSHCIRMAESLKPFSIFIKHYDTMHQFFFSKPIIIQFKQEQKTRCFYFTLESWTVVSFYFCWTERIPKCLISERVTVHFALKFRFFLRKSKQIHVCCTYSLPSLTSRFYIQNFSTYKIHNLHAHLRATPNSMQRKTKL